MSLREFDSYIREVRSRVRELQLPEYRLVICRSDLPENPDWEKLGYPYPYCWDPLELMKKASESGEKSPLWSEARRIYWEMYWRAMGRYKRGRPFPEVYFCNTKAKACIRGIPDVGTEEDERVRHIVEAEVIMSAQMYGVAKRGRGLFYWVFRRRPLRG